MDRIINLKSQIVPMGLPPGLQSIGKGLGTGGKPLYNIAQIASMLYNEFLFRRMKSWLSGLKIILKNVPN